MGVALVVDNQLYHAPRLDRHERAGFSIVPHDERGLNLFGLVKEQRANTAFPYWERQAFARRRDAHEVCVSRWLAVGYRLFLVLGGLLRS